MLPGYPHGPNDPVQKLTSLSYEGKSLPVFFIAWTLSHEHQARSSVAHSEDEVGTLLAKPTPSAVTDLYAKLRQGGLRIGNRPQGSGDRVRTGPVGEPGHVRFLWARSQVLHPGLPQEEQPLPELGSEFRGRGAHALPLRIDSMRSNKRAATSLLEMSGSACSEPSAAIRITRLFSAANPTPGSSTGLATTKSSRFSRSFRRADSA